ncbi:MAG: PA14 domain-containing protein, partial [Verrucomicrobiota bacterium]
MDTAKKVLSWRWDMTTLRIALTLVSCLVTFDGWSQPVGNGDGLWASYYDNRHLSGTAVMSRVEPKVDFDWGLGAPTGMTNSDEFSVRWTGELQAQFTETYSLYVESDDGVRVWLNEQLVINDWLDSPTNESSATVNLIAGQKYFLRVEFYENHFYAGVRLKWSSQSTPKQVIPQSQLYSVPTDADNNGLADLWEIAHFGATGVNPAGDADADGLSNFVEYRRYSDPKDPLDQGVPNEWTHGNMGSAMGDATYTNGVFTVASTGRVGTNNVVAGADSFHFFYQPMEGNGQVVARVLGTSGLDGLGSLAKVGVMVRLTLKDN